MKYIGKVDMKMQLNCCLRNQTTVCENEKKRNILNRYIDIDRYTADACIMALVYNGIENAIFSESEMLHIIARTGLIWM